MGNMSVLKAIHHLTNALLIVGMPIQIVLADTIKYDALIRDLPTLRENHISAVEFSFIENDISITQDLIDKSLGLIIKPVKKFLQKENVTTKETGELLVELCSNLNAMIQTNKSASDLYDMTINKLKNEYNAKINTNISEKIKKWIRHYEKNKKMAFFLTE